MTGSDDTRIIVLCPIHANPNHASTMSSIANRIFAHVTRMVRQRWLWVVDVIQSLSLYVSTTTVVLSYHAIGLQDLFSLHKFVDNIYV